MASPASSSSNTIHAGNTEIPTVTTTTKTEFIGFDGKVLRSTVDESGKAVRIHKVITTTTTVTCFGDEALPSNGDRTAEEKFVDHVKELSVDTKDVLLHTAAGVQHALESAGDYIRTQLSTTPSSEHVEKLPGKESNDLLHQAALFKDVIVQKAMDVKDATVDVLKELTAPQEQPTTVNFHHGTTTITTTDKKHE